MGRDEAIRHNHLYGEFKSLSEAEFTTLKKIYDLQGNRTDAWVNSCGIADWGPLVNMEYLDSGRYPTTGEHRIRVTEKGRKLINKNP